MRAQFSKATRTLTAAGRGRRSRGAAWLAADARDVTRVDLTTTSAPRPVPSVAVGVTRWRGRVERRRLLAVGRRSLLVAAAAACVLELAALATGRRGAGIWLVPAAAAFLASLAFGAAHRPSPAAAARMFDRARGEDAVVDTALELEAANGRGRRDDLAALVSADGREAHGRHLAGARVRVRSSGRELAVFGALAAALAGLLLLPPPGGGRAGSTAEARRTGAAVTAAGGARTVQPSVGATLSGFGQTPLHAPPLAAVAAASSANPGSPSGHSPYGGGIATKGSGGSTVGVSKTVGQAGSIAGTQAADAAGSGEASARGSGSVGAETDATAGGAAGEGVQGIGPVTAGGQALASPSERRSGAPGAASTTAGGSRGGGGSSAAAEAPGGRSSRRATPGGATAGGQRGTAAPGLGVVPQLGGGSRLPIEPGYEAVQGSRGAEGTSASSAQGAGGASHTGRAGGPSGRGAGQDYVPPGSAKVPPWDRLLLLSYFGSYARLTATGW